MRAPKSDAQVSSIVECRVVHVGGRCSLSDRVNPYRLPAQPLPIWYRTAVSSAQGTPRVTRAQVVTRARASREKRPSAVSWQSSRHTPDCRPNAPL
jgi:hypothetical protein